MQNEVKKITRLIAEMTAIFMKRGSNNIDVNIRRVDSLSIITIVDFNTTYDDEEIEELNEILNIQRQCEVEGFYWELMAEDNNGDELFLVGSMIDSAQVKKENDNLVIIMNRVGPSKSKHKNKKQAS